MYRTSVVRAIVLRTFRIGDIHKNVTLFTQYKGLIQAIAHGAYKTKGKLRSLTETFSSIKVYLYLNPVKNQYKITDIECVESFDSFRNNLIKFYAASLLAEIVLSSFGGGDSSKKLFILFLNSLKLINKQKQQIIVYIIIQFIWKYLDVSGFNSKLTICHNCGNLIKDNNQVFYSIRDSKFVCDSCSYRKSIYISQGIRKYLIKTDMLSIDEAIKIRLEKEDLLTLKRALFHLIQTLLEKELYSIKTGIDIL